MNKIMKKLLTLGTLALGLLVLAKAPAFASFDYETSTWQAKFLSYISTATDPSRPTGLAGGLSPTGSFDFTRAWISTGTDNGAYFVCVDSLPLSAQTGGAPAYSINNFPAEDYVFPPVPIVKASSSTVGGLNGLLVDLRDTVFGGGHTIKKGLTCFVVGDTVNRYWWTIETQFVPTRRSE